MRTVKRPCSILVLLLGLAASKPAFAIEIRFNNVSYGSFLNVSEKEKYSFAASSARDFGQFNPTSDEIPSDLRRQNLVEEESESGEIVTARATLDGIVTDPFFSTLSRSPTGNPDARARATYFENKAEADTQRTHSFIGRVDPEEFGYAGNHSALAVSRWVDTWVADKTGIVEIDYSFDADIQLNSSVPNGDFLVAGGDGVVGPTNFNNDLGIVIEQRDRWSFNLSAIFAVFNLDQLVDEEGDDSSALLPANVASVLISGSSDPIELSDDELIDSPDAIALREEGNIFINEAGTLSFLAIAGQRYRVVGSVRTSSFNGVDVDAYNTFSLDAVRVPPGLNLTSLAVTEDGAQLPLEVIPEGKPIHLLGSALALGLLYAVCRRRPTRTP